MRKTAFIAAIALILCCLVSCNPDSILRTGRLMSKTGETVFGASVSSEKAEEVSSLLRDIATLSGDPEEGLEITSEKAQELVNLIQQIKSSPKMVEYLQKELRKPIEVKEAIYSDKRIIVDITNAVFDFLSKIEEKVESVSEYASMLEGITSVEQLREVFSATDIAPLFEDDTIAESIIQLQPYLAGISSYSGQAQGFVNDYVSPFMGFVCDLNDATAKMKESMPEISSDKKEYVSGLALMNGILGEKLVSDVIYSVVEIAVSATESDGINSIIETVSNLVKDLDSISVINPDISFLSLDSLTGTVLSVVGGKN